MDVLTLEKPERCYVCGNGWGTCREEYTCVSDNDGFNAAQEKARETDASVSSRWYTLKGSFNCPHRCEFDQNQALSGKPALLAASRDRGSKGSLSITSMKARIVEKKSCYCRSYPLP